MKRHLMPAIAGAATKKLAFTIFCCVLLMLLAAPVWAQDQCAGALPLTNPGPNPAGGQFPSPVTGCGVLITVNSNGTATVTTPGNNNPYDGVEDTLVGIQNNSGGSFKSITITGPSIFAFDQDGPCTRNPLLSCGPTTYEGPNNTFTITDTSTGTINFTTPLASGQSTWFALEGAPQNVTVGAISETQTLTFNPGTNVQQTATANCGTRNEVTGVCSNPDASSIKIGFDTVMQQFQLQVTFTEVDGNGVCVIPADGNANDSTDFDCTWANFFGDSKPPYGSGPPFTAPFIFPAGTTVNVPYCLHYARFDPVQNKFTKCVDIDVELLNGAAPGTHFSGSLALAVAWNAFPTSSLFPPLGGPWGNDPTVAPRFYDAPHDDSDTVDYPFPIPTGYPYSPSDQQKVFDITGAFFEAGRAGADGIVVCHQPPTCSKTPNHYAVAFPLAASTPDQAELFFPFAKPDPACYVAGRPMSVVFELEKTGTEIDDVTALIAPNYARITVLQGTIPQNVPLLVPVTLFNPPPPFGFLTSYFATLSNANLKTSTSISPTVYTLQIESNLIGKPLTKNFVVKKSCF